MNTTKSVPKPKPKPKPVTRQAVVVLLLLAIVGAVVYWQFFSEPPPTWRVKWQISRYLKRHAGRSDFQVPFNFPSAAAMSKNPSATPAATNAPPRPKRDFDALRSDYIERQKEVLVLRRELSDQQDDLEQQRQDLPAREKELADAQVAAGATNVTVLQSNLTTLRASIAALEKSVPATKQKLAAKEQELAPVLEELRASQKTLPVRRSTSDASETNEVAVARNELFKAGQQVYDDAASYEAMYTVLGQQLWVANRLFGSKNLQHRRVAMSIVRQARSDAVRQTQDTWLAARICEGYIWPNLDAADYTNWRSTFSVENLVNECADAFRQAGENEKVISNYERLLSTKGSQQRSDWARVKLSEAYEQSGNLPEALRYLQSVKATNDFAWALRRIPWIERRIKGR